MTWSYLAIVGASAGCAFLLALAVNALHATFPDPKRKGFEIERKSE